MERWLRRQIRRANPLRLFAAALLLGAYGLWLFTAESPFTRALDGAGDRLPELIAGFPGGEPAAALLRLGEWRGDYVWMQAFDLPFVALVILVAVTAIGLALKRLNFATGDQRYLLLVPALYGALELVENGLLALFASGGAEPADALALLQQSVTTLKLAAILLTVVVSVGALIIWSIAAIASLRREAA